MMLLNVLKVVILMNKILLIILLLITLTACDNKDFVRGDYVEKII